MPASDNFTRADAATLGVNWTEDPLRNHVSGSGLSIISNRAAPDGNAVPNLAYWNAESYSGDMEVILTVGTKPGDNSYFELITRIKNPTLASVTAYFLIVRANPGSNDDPWSIWRVDNNTTTTKISPATSPVREFAVGSQLRFRSQDDQHVGAYNPGTGWVDIVSATDVNHNGVGTAYIGWGVDGGPGNTVARASAFSGGSITVASVRKPQAAATGVGR